MCYLAPRAAVLAASAMTLEGALIVSPSNAPVAPEPDPGRLPLPSDPPPTPFSGRFLFLAFQAWYT